MPTLAPAFPVVTAFFLSTHPLLRVPAQVPFSASDRLAPTAFLVAKHGKALFVACATANRVICVDTASGNLVQSIELPCPPTGLIQSADGTELYVTCSAPESRVCIFSAATFKPLATILAGHAAMAPVLSSDGKLLYVCERFENAVAAFDLALRKEVRRIPVQPEPIAADLTKDGKHLLVANQLHQGRADQERVAAVVSVIEVASDKVVKEIQLPNGSTSLKQIRVSPDGKYAAVSHLVASFNRATTSVQLGWLNANALSIIDLSKMELFYTVLLDTPGRGAANPWGLAWSQDGQILVVTHAGTHEISVVDFPALLKAIAAAKAPSQSLSQHALPASDKILTFLMRYEGMEAGLPYLTGARKRIRLPATDLGPREVSVVGHTAYVTNHFSDTVSVLDLASPSSQPVFVPSHAHPASNGRSSANGDPLAGMSLARKGEFYFHDATICFQGWQSCSSCHPDGRADGLNWDLLNDGIGNPKNTKSLLLAHQTPPAMSLGVRETAEMAVRSGLRHILFTNAPEEIAVAIDEYLKSLKPEPSPHLVNGKLSPSAERGKQVFAKAGCITCHPPPLFTDQNHYDVGTRAPFDKPTDQFDTPTLIELWRTAPYLHDGSAATVRDVLTRRNPHDQHGTTSNLSATEIDDLCAYLLSL